MRARGAGVLRVRHDPSGHGGARSGNPPDGLMVGCLSTEVITLAGDRWAVEAERDDESGGWATSAHRLADEDTGTRWESQP